MRVRILKPFYHARKKRAYKPNEIVDVKKDEAELWMYHGMAMQDKSFEPTENKALDIQLIETKLEITPRPKPETTAPAPKRYHEGTTTPKKRTGKAKK